MSQISDQIRTLTDQLAAKDARILELETQLRLQDQQLAASHKAEHFPALHRATGTSSTAAATTASSSSAWHVRPDTGAPSAPSTPPRTSPVHDSFAINRSTLHIMPRDLAISVRQAGLLFREWLLATHQTFSYELRHGSRGSIILSVPPAQLQALQQILATAVTDNACPFVCQAPTAGGVDADADKPIHKLLNFVPVDVAHTDLRELLLHDNAWLAALQRDFDSRIDFDSLIQRSLQRATRGLEQTCCTTELNSILLDDKLMKGQRISLCLREAAAKAWQSSMSGTYAGTTLTDQVLLANDWRKAYRDLSDGALRIAFKLNGEQHCFRSKSFLAATSSTGDRCRVCGSARETAAHLLGGSCTGTSDLCIRRHDMVHKFISDCFKSSDHWRVEDLPGLPRDLSPHYKPDMLVCSVDGRKCWVLDPTVRYERSDADVEAAIVDKREKYNWLCEYLKRTRSFTDVAVEGLFFGARGILLHRTTDFLVQTFGLDIQDLLLVSGKIMNYTTSIYSKVVSGHLTRSAPPRLPP